MQEFMKSLQHIYEAIKIWQTKSNDRFSHIDKSEMEKVQKILTTKQKWYDQTANRFNTLRPHEDPAVLCSQINQERDVRHFLISIEFVFKENLLIILDA
jgi:hypothetical protein